MTLPRSAWRTPRRPWVPMTMRSAPTSVAASTIFFGGCAHAHQSLPCAPNVRVSTGMELEDLRAGPFSEIDRRHRQAWTPGRTPAEPRRGRMSKSVESRARARSTATSTACAEHSLKSVGTRILRNWVISSSLSCLRRTARSMACASPRQRAALPAAAARRPSDPNTLGTNWWGRGKTPRMAGPPRLNSHVVGSLRRSDR